MRVKYHEDMKSAYITVVGNLPVSFDMEQTRKLGPVIASANANRSMTYDYATVNTETNLQDMLNSANFRGTELLVPEKLFKKYVFFDGVNCLPEFPGLKSYPVELTRLKSIAIANPATKFMYICNPPRTYQLDDLANGFCDTFIKFQELIDDA